MKPIPAGRPKHVLEDLVQSVEAILWEMDPSTWCFTFVSDYAVKLLGHPIERWLSEAHFWENVILHPSDRDWAVKYCLAAIAEKRDHELVYRAQAADGRVVWLRDRVRLIVDQETGRLMARGVMFDITDRVDAEAAMRASQNQLHQAQKMESVGRLAGGVAHDFNNLLTAIIGNARLVLDDLDPDCRSCEDVKEILSSGERAAEITRQLLAFSRKQVLFQQSVDLNDVVAKMDLILRRLIGENIQLITELDVIRPVRADPGQMSQVVLNLVVNARDAIDGEGFVRMKTADIELDETKHHRFGDIPAGSYVMLTVADTGSGIKDADLENIFEPFFTTKSEGKGTGLGLSTVYGVVTQSGGYVGVDSKPDTGTKFSLYFPSITHAPAPITDT